MVKDKRERERETIKLFCFWINVLTTCGESIYNQVEQDR